MEARTFGWSAALVVALLGLSFTLAAAALGVRAADPPGAVLAPMVADDQTVVLVGKLEVAEKNLIGQTKRVALVDPVLGRFVIADEGAGRGLKRYIGEGVTVIGVVRPRAPEGEAFVVTAYRLHYT